MDTSPRTGRKPLVRRPPGQFATELGLCAFGFIAVTAAMLGPYRASPSWARPVVGLVAAAGLVGVYAAAVRWVEGRRVVEVSLHRLPRAVVGAVVGSLLVAVTVGVVMALGGYRVTGTQSLDVLLPRIGPSLHSAAWEELAFRGVLFRHLATWRGAPVAVTLSAALFGAMHGLLEHGTLWSAVAVAVEAGVLLSVAYWVTQDLWLPIGLHFGWNLTLGGVAGSAVSGQTVPSVVLAVVAGPTWITGGTFGLEASLPAVCVCAVAAGLLWKQRDCYRGLTTSDSRA